MNLEIMRRTRSNSYAGVVSGGRRSLRNANDHFDGIPTKMRNRMPHPENKSDGITKHSSTRRSVRLSGGSLEMLQLGSRTRKRRLHSFGSPDRGSQRGNIVETLKFNGPKSPKVENSPQAKGTSSPTQPVENGICSRTRRKFESVTQKISASSSSTSSSQKSSSTSPSPTQKHGRFSPRRLKQSPSNVSHCANGESNQSENMESKKLEHSVSTEKQADELMDNDTSASEKVDSDDPEKFSNCQCGEDCDLHSSKETNIKCELCGKQRPLETVKNGSVVNRALDTVALNPRNLRSGGRPTADPPHSSMNNSPMAGQEAGGKEVSVETGDSNHASNNEHNLQDCMQDQPEPDKRDHEAIEEIESVPKNTQPSFTPENRDNNSNLQDCQTNGQNVNLESGNVMSNDIQGTGFNVIEEKPSVNGLNSEIIDEFSHVNLDLLSEGEDCLSYSRKKRKMNLRSSGVRCDPDFYTLSLDLMIKRPRLKSNICKTEEDDRSIVIGNGEESVENEVINTDTDAAERSEVNLSTESDNKNSHAIKDGTSSNELAESYPSSPCTSSTPMRPPSQKIQPRIGRHLVDNSITKLQRSPNIRMVLKDPCEPPPLFAEEPPTGPDVYYFESDHVALKHNRDYHKLLHTVTILESQRNQCLNDIKVLEAKKSEGLGDPIAFVEKLQSKEQLSIPTQQSVPDLPAIEWSEYSSLYGTFDHVFSRELLSSPKKPITRKVKIKLDHMKNCRDKTRNQGPRSQSFGVPWSVEEQRKLEELLIKYPSEENESSRYRKVAKELGTRTAVQVQSRVQKYFIKLAKAGLPVPGTMPRIDKFKSRTSTRARTHPHLHLTKLSTFFPTFHCPVKMQDDEPGTPASNDGDDGFNMDQDQVSDEEDVPDEMRFSDEYLEILRLKRIRRDRLKVFDNGQQALAKHVGYECDMCNTDPIQGVRYHCIDCPSEEGVDLCQSCIRWQGQFETDKHKASHRMEPVYRAENFVDDDYLKFVSRSGEYNYLDPNFFPQKT